MEIFIIALIIIIIFVITLKLFITQKNKQEEVIGNEVSLSFDNIDNYFPDIQIIESNTLIPSEKNKIVDENIKKAVSIIDNYTSNGTIMTRNIKNASKLLNNDKAFFSSAKKETEKMLKVKGTNEVYGAQMKGNKFNKQTKFLREDDLIKAQEKTH